MAFAITVMGCIFAMTVHTKELQFAEGEFLMNLPRWNCVLWATLLTRQGSECNAWDLPTEWRECGVIA